MMPSAESPKFTSAPRSGGVGSPDPSGRGRLQCRVAADIVATLLGVPVAEILADRRARAPVAHARHMAMYLAHVAFQLPLTTVAAGFDRDRSSIAYAVTRIEDERDDRGFDALMTRMEQLALSCRRLAVPGAGDEDF